MSIFSLPLGGSLPESCQGGAVAIGNFDGVHLGHQALLAEVVRQARSVAGPAVAVTFSPHPLLLLKPELFQPELTTLHERVQLLTAHGADHVVVLETTRSLLNLSAWEFFEQVVRTRLKARTVVEGFNFAFGKNREGTTAVLQSLGAQSGIHVVLAPALEFLGKPVSSSRVRHEIVAGNVAMARRLLGRWFRLQGIVEAGQSRGQTLGFPTANLAKVATLAPGDGVYAALVRHQGKTWPAAANIGPNPTFGENARKIEVHLIGFHGNLYGQELAVDFVEHLRPTRKFADVGELKNQLKADVSATIEIVTKLPPNC